MVAGVEEVLTEVAVAPTGEALRVLADQLLERGDVHGEFISLQLARAERRQAPSAREEQLRVEVLEPRLRAALGDEAHRLAGCTWRHGFLSSVRLACPDARLTALARLAARPEARLLEGLTLDAVERADEPSLAPLWAQLAASGLFPALKALRVREPHPLADPERDGPAHLGDVAPLYAAFPLLEELELHGYGHALGQIALPSLRRFAASTLDADDVDALAHARWPRLVELDLTFGPAHGEAEPLFGPLLQARMSEQLQRVRVKSPWPEFFGAALPRSPLGRGREVEV